ncbi:MAG: hypothetical protein HYY06_15625 [Deltaproteobacteria bacterium]|nr:hypothetical protein [Deltaproteobacteria bacterium]
MRRLLPVVLTGALGVNLWVILICLPAVHVGIGTGGWILCALPLAVLVAGAAFTLRPPVVQSARRLAPPSLLLGYPAGLLVPLTALRDLTGVNVYGPGNLVVAAAAVLAYGAGALFVIGRVGLEPTPHRSVPIQGWAIDASATRRKIARGIVLTSAALVPATMIWAAYLRPGLAEDVSGAYGSSAQAATVAIGAAALALPVGVLLVYFGPPLRRPALEEPIASPARRLRGTVLLLALAALASIALVWMRAVS